MPDEPGMNLRNRMLVERQVPVVRGDPHIRTRDVLAEPAAVVGRDELVLVPVADEHGNGDRLEPEAPGRDEGEVVVEPAVDAPRLDDTRVEVLGQTAGQDGEVGGAEQRRQLVPQSLRTAGVHCAVPLLEQRTYRGLALERRVELDDILLATPGQPVETVRVVWCR